MAVRLRLTRVGKKKQPSYRIVAADARSPRDGKYLEIVGTYDPRREPSAITVDNEKAIEWLKKGAQPSERVQKLLVISGAWDEFQASKASK
ncbi:SSU ribosomal protein S16P [Actinobacteria bacterium IMCC26207]|uniref:30S ribosomal protein S16 n=1 Tax=freshwater metagenome TaxID=449393 RepID=A0A6J7UBE4_9ZZZZ|nr:SSU ribosomal protein S16P [Actinobacteria bacterium IMCC26207]MCX6524571.1 30S ribosomal protein S16 [Actinomycetota bacterium]MSV84361.1 30S ribosomal protein S16 [Actinomycetota bacterium]MSX01377.1 30S ribosomal protein S16 [Actinomycetota bacterium]MSX75490.1 30S ribosomal protein S16 [Actinomycetota bacterium]